MNIGTKSVLVGAHCFILHPWFVARAWWQLYGFPWDPRLWVAFFVHDLGYFGKPNMDGPEGEQHPVLGANIMKFLFDGEEDTGVQVHTPWHDLVLFHSRYLAKKQNQPFSKLCVADKLAICLEPWWLYLPRVRLSGEIHEYLKNASMSESGRFKAKHYTIADAREWFDNLCSYMRQWVAEHKDGKEDTWTRVRH